MRRVNTFLLGAICALLAVAVYLQFGQMLTVRAQGGGSGHKSKYVSSAATTPITDGLSFLNSITINGGTAGAVTLYDIAASGCTGTPGSGKFATIETIGTTNPVTLFYDQRISSGLCMVTAAATDLTVNFD